jgi:hypothetical protein
MILLVPGSGNGPIGHALDSSCCGCTGPEDSNNRSEPSGPVLTTERTGAKCWHRLFKLQPSLVSAVSNSEFQALHFDPLCKTRLAMPG